DLWWQQQLDPTLSLVMPHAVRCAQDNLYGMHVYSRLPLNDIEVTYLVEDNVPSIHAGIRLRSGDCVRAHFLHPAPPSPTENDESSQRDAELVIVARRVALERNLPVIVSGDLNDVAWSATTQLFIKVSGLLDPRIGRGMFNTYHAKIPFLRWPLDHLFHSEHFTLHRIDRLALPGSDHFALYTELYLNPARRDEQDGERPDEDERAWAQRIADKEDVSRNDVPKTSTAKAAE
ncbi:MAG: endonuclease/exonuclease/phosphatase family protein, partial [Natronospirillum sp.]